MAADRPRLRDLFSGAGGGSMGDSQAAFDVVGVDHQPQPRYPFAFVQALEYLAAHGHEYAVIHASPPCQRYANVTRWRGDQTTHPDLLPSVLERLRSLAIPWVIENIPGAPLRCDVQLCGSMFGLRVQRHRWFMSSVSLFALPPCDHRALLPFAHKNERTYADAMGCHWMTKVAAREAIPPAYTHWRGQQLLRHLAVKKETLYGH